MKRTFIAPGLLALSIGISACSSTPHSATPVGDAQGIVSTTDWSKSETIDVTLSKFAFTPTDLTLRRQQPYKLHLVNTSSDTHTYSSDDLFSAVVVQKVVRAGIETPGIAKDGVSLGPNEEADLFLVPVNEGNYRIYCDEFMHDTMGMHGTVTIK